MSSNNTATATATANGITASYNSATGVLTLTFKVADDHKLLLLDLKDLRAMLQFVSENAGSNSIDHASQILNPSKNGIVQVSGVN